MLNPTPLKSFVLTGTVLLMTITSTEGQSWKHYYDSTALYWNSDWKKTVVLLEEAEKDVRIHLPPDHEEYLTVTTDLAVAYWNTNDYDNAGRLLSSSFSTRPEYYSSNHQSELLKTIHGLASWYLEHGHTRHSKFYYSTITRNKLNASESMLYYTAALNLIRLYEHSSVTDSALFVWQSVTDNYPSDLRQDVQWMLTYSRLLSKSGQPSQALAVLEDLRNQQFTQRKKNRTAYAEILIALGRTFVATMDYTSAIASFREAAKILDHEPHPEKIAALKEATALAYQLSGKPAKAIAYYRKTIPLVEKENGLQSYRTAQLSFEYGQALYAAKKYKQAIRIYEDALVLLQKHIPETDIVFITLLKNLASSYTQVHDHHAAYVCLRWAYEMLDRNSESQQLIAREVIEGLANVYLTRGDNVNAASFHREADELHSTRN